MNRHTLNIILVLCFFVSSFSFSQQTQLLDSLRNLYVTQQGIERIQTLDELAWQLRNTNDSLGIYYAQEALVLSKKIKYPKGISNAYNRLGGIAKHQKDYGNAIQYYNKALIIDKQHSNSFGIARVYNQLGLIATEQRKPVLALENYIFSLQAFEQIEKQKQAARVAKNIGNVYLSQNANEDALVYFLKALEYTQLENNSILKADICKRLGDTHINLENYEKALKYYQNAAKIYSEKNAIESNINTEIVIATTYDFLNQNTLAKSTFSRTLKSINTHKKGKKGVLFLNWAILYRKLKRQDSAFVYYEKAIQHFKQRKDTTNLCLAYNNLGNLFTDRKTYTKALNSLQKSLKLQQKSKDSSVLKHTYNAISEVYGNLKQYPLAYQYKDSSYAIAKKEFLKIKSADRYEVAYVNERLKSESAISKQKIAEEQNTTKNTFIIGLVCSIILLSGLFFYRLKAQKQQRQKLILIHEKEKQDQEIQALISTQEMNAINAMISGQEKERKRIAEDLHDNFGIQLALIKVLYQSVGDTLPEQAKENYSTANQLLDKACKDVRKIAHNMITGTLSNFGLIPSLKELQKNLQKMYLERSEKQIAIQMTFHKLDDRLDNSIEIQIYRIIQELLNNIIKHADASKIDIQLMQYEGNINIIVEDDGIGFDPKETQQGIGLKTLHSRVNKLQGTYHIDSGKGNGTTVSIDIPIQNTTQYEEQNTD